MVREAIASLLQQDAFWMKLGAEKRLAASAQRSLIPPAFNLLALILSMHYSSVVLVNHNKTKTPFSKAKEMLTQL